MTYFLLNKAWEIKFWLHIETDVLKLIIYYSSTILSVGILYNMLSCYAILQYIIIFLKFDEVQLKSMMHSLYSDIFNQQKRSLLQRKTSWILYRSEYFWLLWCDKVSNFWCRSIIIHIYSKTCENGIGLYRNILLKWKSFIVPSEGMPYNYTC